MDYVSIHRLNTSTKANKFYCTGELSGHNTQPFADSGQIRLPKPTDIFPLISRRKGSSKKRDKKVDQHTIKTTARGGFFVGNVHTQSGCVSKLTFCIFPCPGKTEPAKAESLLRRVVTKTVIIENIIF